MTAQDLASHASAFQMWGSYFIILGAIIVLAVDRLQIEISAIGIVATLLLFFTFSPVNDPNGNNLLGPTQILAGFANPVLFTILALLIIGQGLFQTGAIERPTKMVAKFGNSKPAIAFAATLIVAGITSAFLNNTPVVVIFIPIMSAMALAIGMNLGRVLMPLSFISILGGMTTLIGSSSNLIVAAIAEGTGFGKIGFFDFSIMGSVLASVGALYVIFILPRIVHTQARESELESRIRGKQFLTEFEITADHPWLGAKSKAGFFSTIKDMTVRMVHRDGKTFMRPIEDLTLKDGDIVSVAATRRALISALTDPSGIYQSKRKSTDSQEPSVDIKAALPGREHMVLAEAVIAPSSRLLGLKFEQVALRLGKNVKLVGIERRRRMLRQPKQSIHLEAGDVLLLMGERDDVRNVRQRSDLYFGGWSLEELPTAHHATRAILIFAVTIFTAATGILPIVVSAITGALALVLTGCLNLQQVTRAIDQRIYLLIGTAFALSEALRVTGGAEVLARTVVDQVAVHGPAVLLSSLFLVTAILTNFLSNQATAALMTPVTLSATQQMGVDPTPFVYGLIFALNCSFATPIAYQTNLMVMGPGNYTFGDFMKGGAPLVILLWLTYSLLAPYYFGL